jgi:hypothetical protein
MFVNSAGLGRLASASDDEFQGALSYAVHVGPLSQPFLRGGSAGKRRQKPTQTLMFSTHSSSTLRRPRAEYYITMMTPRPLWSSLLRRRGGCQPEHGGTQPPARCGDHESEAPYHGVMTHKHMLSPPAQASPAGPAAAAAGDPAGRRRAS